MKLHLGCGTVYLEDWVNIDVHGELAEERPDLVEHNITTIDNYYKYPYGKATDIGKRPGGNSIVVDERWDITALPYQVKENSIDRILVVGVLEHFDRKKGIELLHEWWRILKTDGELWVDVPDLEQTIHLIEPYSNQEQIEYVMHLIYGSQKDRWAYHKWGYTFWSLHTLCLQVGFIEVAQMRNPIKHEYPMIMVKAIK